MHYRDGLGPFLCRVGGVPVRNDGNRVEDLGIESYHKYQKVVHYMLVVWHVLRNSSSIRRTRDKL